MRISDGSSDVCSSELRKLPSAEPKCEQPDQWLTGLHRLMPRHGTLRGVGLTALGAVVVAGSFVALGLRPDGIASYYRDTLTPAGFAIRSEEHTSELQSLMRISYAVFCLKKKIR